MMGIYLEVVRVGMMMDECNSKDSTDKNVNDIVADMFVIGEVVIIKECLDVSVKRAEGTTSDIESSDTVCSGESTDKSMNGSEKDLRNKDSVKSYAKVARDNVFQENNKLKIV
ncbi:hypothetical protein Tco_1515181, partial [Tanacetum coccineum]